MRVQNSRLAPRVLAGALATALVVLAAAPAHAAPPANDTFGGSVTIGALPFAATQDTTEATTDADDAETNIPCGAPATDASVWYSLTAATDGALLVDASESTFSPGITVVTGAPGSFELIDCGPFAVALETTAGTTYHLLLFDFQGDGGGNGGTLRLSVDTAPPPPDVAVVVDARAQFNSRTGSATVSGTFTCSGVVEFSEVQVELLQRVGRGVVYGFGFAEVPCDGTAAPFAVEVTPAFGGTKFAGGKAASVTIGFACGPVFCGVDFQERIVQLSKR